MTSTSSNGDFLSSQSSDFSSRSSTATPSRPGIGDSALGGSESRISRSAPSASSKRPPSVLRKSSFTKAPKSAHKTRAPSLIVTQPPASDREYLTKSSRPSVSVVIPSGRPRLTEARSPDSFRRVADIAEATLLPHSAVESRTPTTPFGNMSVLQTGGAYRAERPSTSHGSNGVPALPSIPTSNGRPSSPTLESITYQHIQEMASKRISTLDYLRKAHEGRVYWFNTLLFNKTDLNKMPYFDSRKLGRRATNYLLLGLSIPAVLDANSSTPAEFLRTFNALLSEFESYQQIHPPDGSSSSLSRARIPQMFKRATGAAAGKGRRTSSAAEIGMPASYEVSDASGSIASSAPSAAISLPTGDVDLMPGEEYMYLATPSLPFDPDFYETFATLCDVLIDCYTRLMGLISSPQQCNPGIAELFTKTDARVRKIIIQGVVKEFEDGTRSGVKSEVAGVGKVVLGGLI